MYYMLSVALNHLLFVLDLQLLLCISYLDTVYVVECFVSQLYYLFHVAAVSWRHSTEPWSTSLCFC